MSRSSSTQQQQQQETLGGGRCFTCGDEASLVCSRCKDVNYCSVACQKKDWKRTDGGGHKALCKGPQSARTMQKVLLDLFNTEWTWLKGPSTFKSEFYSEFSEECIPLNHMFGVGRVALVLARANLCAFLTEYSSSYPWYGCDYYRKVLSPWYRRRKDFLSQEGFSVECISHPIHFCDKLCTRLHDGKLCGKLRDFNRGSTALVKATRSPKLELVNQVFTIERSTSVDRWKEGEKVTFADMFECLSFARTPRKETDDVEEDGDVAYIFENPNQVFGDTGKFCCSNCFPLPGVVLPSDDVALGKHFVQARKAMASLGFSIVMNLANIVSWPMMLLQSCGWKLPKETSTDWNRS